MGCGRIPAPCYDRHNGYAYACDDGKLVKVTCTPIAPWHYEASSYEFGQGEPIPLTKRRKLDGEACQSFIERFLANPLAVLMELRL
jgi:hypothetical protein